MRLVAATLLLLAGGGVTASTYWAFLNTPESTVWTLLLSAVLALLALTILSLTINAAIAVWSSGPPSPFGFGETGWSLGGLRRTLPHVTSIVPAALVALLFWLLARAIDVWMAQHNGQINAWFIARFGWDDVTWVFTTVRWIATWLRWVIGGLLAVSLMAGIAAVGWRAIAGPAWVGRSLRPRTLLLATVWFVVLIVLPWVYLVPWRPGWVPATSAEMTFIVTKLSVAAILIAAGVALMIYEAVRVPTVPTDPQSQQIAA